MKFEILKKAIVESASADWQINGNGRGQHGARMAEFAENSDQLYALNNWVVFGWDGISQDDWERMEALIANYRKHNEGF